MPAKDRACQGRHKPLDVYQMIELSWGDGTNKSHRYGELLRAIMTDQVAWIHDHSHERKITEVNGRDSLAVACAPTDWPRLNPWKEPDMLLKRHFERLLLSPADLKPLRDDFEVVGVFNPGAIVAGRRSDPAGSGRGASARAPPWLHGTAALGPRRGSGDRLGSRRHARTARSTSRQAQGRRPRAADVHLALTRCPVRRRPFGEASLRRPLLARDGAGRIRRRRSADHGDRRPVLFHLRRRLAPWRGDRIGLDRPISANSIGTA